MDSSPQVIENAAESALEHHLGMTCDPVAGYVQGSLHRTLRRSAR
jgi:L-serine dehydratase